MTQNVYFINWYNFTSPVHQWVPLHPSTVPVFYVWKNLWRDMVKARFLCVTAITWTLVEVLWLSIFLHHCHTHSRSLTGRGYGWQPIIWAIFPENCMKMETLPGQTPQHPPGSGDPPTTRAISDAVMKTVLLCVTYQIYLKFSTLK